MALRKIVHIDENKCDGCGLCIPNCAEGALQIIDGKVKLIGDIYCDGLGACLGHCPQDAITVIEREAEEFDEKAVEELLSANKKEDGCGCSNHGSHSQHGHGSHHSHGHNAHQGGCPGSAMRSFKQEESASEVKVASRLGQWPVQLTLVRPDAPYFRESDLLVTADCVPFAYGNYHNDFLKGKSLAVGCPKLDDLDFYIDKLKDIISLSSLKSITVLRMEVPCCGGMAYAVKTARERSGLNVPIEVVTIGIHGDVVKRELV